MLRDRQQTFPLVLITDSDVMGAAKRHLDDEQDGNNREILDKLNAAVTLVEDRTGLTILETTWRQWHAVFPSGGVPIFLKRQPIRDFNSDGTMADEDLLTSTLDYVDTDEATQQWISYHASNPTNFELIEGSDPPAIRPTLHADWPTLSSKRDSELYVTYKAGYGRSLTDAPQLVQTAVYVACRYLFDQEQGEPRELTTILEGLDVGDEFTAYSA